MAAGIPGTRPYAVQSGSVYAQPYPPRPVPLSAFGTPLSGWWRRVGAYLIDQLVLLIPVTILAIIVGAVGTTSHWPLSVLDLLETAVVVTIEASYFAILNGVEEGQTVGNIATGIAVRDAQTGAIIGIGRSLLRWVVRLLLYVFTLPGIISDLWPLWDAQHQTLADKTCGTVVIRVR